MPGKCKGFVKKWMYYAADVRSRHRVPKDDKDSPILRAALDAGAHYLVTYDRHLLDLDPYETLRIVHVREYREILRQHGHL